MDARRGRRGRRPARGRGRGCRADVIQDAPGFLDPPPAPIGFQQVGGDAPPVQDPPTVDPPVQDPPAVDPPVQDPPIGDPPAQDPPVGDPPIHIVEDPNEIDEAMAGRVVWRFLQRDGGTHLEAPKTTISERLLAAGTSFFDGASEAAPNLAELWLDHTDRVLGELDYPTDQRLRAYTALLKDQAYNWWGTVQRNTHADQLTSEVFREKFRKRYIGERYLEA
ncbi:hypothetical protein V6N13_133762 [Hibiscus sabdariffa]